MDTYELKVTLSDSGDEFSEGFNPKSEEEVKQFENDIKEVLETGNWHAESVELVGIYIRRP